MLWESGGVFRSAWPLEKVVDLLCSCGNSSHPLSLSSDFHDRTDPAQQLAMSA